MQFSILIVDDEDNFRDGMKQYLLNKGYDVFDASNLKKAREILTENAIDIVMLDVQIDQEYGPDLLFDINKMRPTPKTILITAYGEVEMAVDAMKNGAFDFLSKPINFVVLQATLKRAEENITLQKELERLRTSEQSKFDFIKGKSPLMQQIYKDAKRAADAGVSVLISGETGTGKEVIAKYIHFNGSRSNKQMVSINCAAIQPTVLESELFGHEAGAFTGAIKNKQGLMEIADGGIVFLDEISSMSLEMQSKILRAIEEKKIWRVGGTKEIPVDIQIVAASNKDLKKMIENNQFRSDLYYRLRVVEITLPPLRERKEDIPDFVGFFVRSISQERGLNITSVSPKVLSAFENYRWPGNIRELRNVLERASIFCDGEEIKISDIPSEISNLA